MATATEINSYFRFKCYKGLEERGLAHLPEYQQRLEYEISIVTPLQYASYFLVVSDIINWALSNGIVPGPGRGSAAGALIAYVLKITHLDPIKYGLYFERFLNPERVSPPDIDLDIEDDQRDRVLSYIQEKYGVDRVAHIGTFGKMMAKGSIRDVARTLGYGYDLGDKLASYVLEPIEGKSQSLNICYEKVTELRNIRFGEPSEGQIVLQWAEKMENRVRSYGTHASGILISPEPIATILPLALTKDKSVASQFAMENAEEAGLIKFDILGLRALSTIRRCLELIKERTGKSIDILNIPTDDADVYRMLQKGNVDGIFQLEQSQGMRDLVVNIRPESLEDLGMLIAIYRPGPLGSDALDHYLKVRAGETSPTYMVDELEPILKATDGFLIYQETVMEICKQLAGYTMAQADNMRKVMGKKLVEKMKLEREKFTTGMVKNGFDEKIATALFNEIEGFASYGFNKCLTGDTLLKDRDNKSVSIRQVEEKLDKGEQVFLMSIDHENFIADECLEVINSGIQEIFELEFSDGSKVEATLSHKFFCSDREYHNVKEIFDLGLEIIAME